MNNMDATIKFENGVKIIKNGQLLHIIDLWVGYKMEVDCLMATKKQLVETTKDIEEHKRAAKELE